jgi:L-rhamnose mutarotase
MKLTQTTLDKIKDPAIRRELTVALKCTDQSIIRYINRNEDNGDLTKVAAMEVIRKWTKLTDQEILEEEKVQMEGVTK